MCSFEMDWLATLGSLWRVGRILGLYLATAALLPGATTVTGIVQVREGTRLRPLARATVIVLTADRSKVLGVTKTNDRGYYATTELPESRISLMVRKSGYYIHDAAGHQTENLILDCSQPDDCAGVTFELRRGGVVTGRVVDEYGEPRQDVMAQILRPEQASDRRSWSNDGDSTDDRGMFRFAGLKPGRYIIRAIDQRGWWSRSTRETGDTIEVDVRSGEELSGLQIVLDQNPERTRLFTVSGKVTGLDLSEPGTRMLGIRSLSVLWSRSIVTTMGSDGSFLFDDVSPGENSFFYINADMRFGWSTADASQIQMGLVNVSEDIHGLTLRPQSPAGFRGKITFDAKPLDNDISLWFRIDGNASQRRVLATAPDYTFEIDNLLPGNYRVSVSGGGPRQLFVKGIRRGADLEPASHVVATEGKIEEIEVVLSGEYSRVHGRVKAGREEGRVLTGGQYIVGLKGRDRVRSAQADQNGRFSFDRIPPGDYRICAWPVLRSGEIRDDHTWEQAGPAVRSFAVKVGSDIEIDLTAVQ